MEKTLLDKACSMKEEDAKKAKNIVQSCNDVLRENQKIASKIEQLQKSGDQTALYITMIESIIKLKSVEEELLLSDAANRIRVLSFKRNSDLTNMLNKPWPLGKLGDASTVEKFEYEMDVNIKSRTDRRSCRPVGSALCSNELLVLTDEYNNSMKLVDLKHNVLLSELKLSSSPLGMCKISDTRVAVAQYEKTVFANTEPSLNIEREFAIDTACHGIAYHNEKLIISYDSRMEVLDMQGNILNTFKNDKQQGQPLFKYPYHAAINHETSLIYVSNSSFDNVLCMKFDGTVVAKYMDNELKRPWQVIVDSCGMVYVCGEESHNIHQITADCKKVKILLKKADGLQHPRTISFVEDHGKLIIGGGRDSLLKIFNAKYE